MGQKHSDGFINLRYSTLRLKRINNLVKEGFSWTQSVNIRNFEEIQPEHYQPECWKKRLDKNE